MQVRPMEIRAAKKGDAEEVYSLADQLNPVDEVDHDAFMEAFPAALKDDHDCCLVCLVDDQVMGYLCGYRHPALYATGPVAYLDEMVVAEELRHSGVGTRLVEAFEEWAREQGCKLVGLATTGAGSFYEALGYQSEGSYYRKSLAD